MQSLSSFLIFLVMNLGINLYYRALLDLPNYWSDS